MTELEHGTSVNSDIGIDGSNDEFWTTVLSREVKKNLEGQTEVPDNYYNQLLESFERAVYSRYSEQQKGGGSRVRRF